MNVFRSVCFWMHVKKETNCLVNYLTTGCVLGVVTLSRGSSFCERRIRKCVREKERERVKWSRNTSVFVSVSPPLQLQWPECRGKMMLFIISEKGKELVLREGGQKE